MVPQINIYLRFKNKRMPHIVKYFKGGSLSGTFLISKKNILTVRKQVSLKNNREFGYQRWLTQMKKIQNYNSKIKNIFPDIIDTGVVNDKAYFDIKYYKNYINCFEYLNNKKKINTKKLLNKILNKSDKFYQNRLPTMKNNIQLYFEEEIKQRLSMFKKKQKTNFFVEPFLYFNGEKINHLEKNLNFLKKIFLDNSSLIQETYVHGNLTLENILYNKKKIIFIDPYEENYVDTIYNDYSQLLQSCNSNYELLNSSKFNIKKNRIDVKYKISDNMIEFNKLFKIFLIKNFDFNEIMLIRAFEISQFIRMIPFKLIISPKKAILFYALSSKLINNLKYDFKNKIKF